MIKLSVNSCCLEDNKSSTLSESINLHIVFKNIHKNTVNLCTQSHITANNVESEILAIIESNCHINKKKSPCKLLTTISALSQHMKHCDVSLTDTACSRKRNKMLALHYAFHFLYNNRLHTTACQCICYHT